MGSTNGEDQTFPANTSRQDEDARAIASALGMTPEEARAFGLLTPPSPDQSAPWSPDQSDDYEPPARQVTAQRSRWQFWRRQEC